METILLLIFACTLALLIFKARKLSILIISEIKRLIEAEKTLKEQNKVLLDEYWKEHKRIF